MWVMNVVSAISVARPLTLQDSPWKRTSGIGSSVPGADPRTAKKLGNPITVSAAAGQSHRLI